MMLGLVAIMRFLHFVAITLLFGQAAFPFYAKADDAQPARFSRVLKTCIVLAFITGWLELDAMTANMGDSLSSTFDPQVFAAVITDTAFGRIWLARLVLATFMLGFCLRPTLGKSPLLLLASGLLLASVALTGHSAIPGGWLGRLHEIGDAVHLLAAGWWIGGLLALVMVVPRLGRDVVSVLSRFSRIGYAAVAVIIASGVFQSLILLGNVSALVRSPYGWVLLVKVSLFACMGALALSNRLQLTPALERNAKPRGAVAKLSTQVAVELGLGIAVLAVVGLLGSMQPPA